MPEVGESLDGPGVLRTYINSTIPCDDHEASPLMNHSLDVRNLILELHEKLDIPGDICVIHGDGGVGKKDFDDG